MDYRHAIQGFYRDYEREGFAQEIRGKNVLVIGTGLSGIGAARLLRNVGAKVVLFDQNEKASKEEILKKLGNSEGVSEGKGSLEICIGELTPEKSGEAAFDFVVPSPAVPLDSPLLSSMKEEGIPVLSEIELGYLFERGRILAITGTNGKTTTTTLVGEIMKAAADAAGPGAPREVFVVGNIGRSYAEASLDTAADTVTVGEISSFQLEASHVFRPFVSAILNITPDHLNRHYTMENYAAIKERIARNQGPENVCVLNWEDTYLRPYGEHLCPARVVWFSSAAKLREGFFLDGDSIVRARIDEKTGERTEEYLMDVHDMHLVGVCNAENVMAAIAITEAAGVPMETILKVVHSFPPVPHRIEFIAEKGGVKYYNDSKATNPDAAIQGIRAMKGPTILIGGGYDKKNDYGDWIDAFDGKVKKLVLIGQTREDIAACARARGFDEIVFCDSYDECLAACTAMAVPGDEVLLSPACASWGMFPNYEVRGDLFRDYVLGLQD